MRTFVYNGQGLPAIEVIQPGVLVTGVLRLRLVVIGGKCVINTAERQRFVVRTIILALRVIADYHGLGLAASVPRVEIEAAPKIFAQRSLYRINRGARSIIRIGYRLFVITELVYVVMFPLFSWQVGRVVDAVRPVFAPKTAGEGENQDSDDFERQVDGLSQHALLRGHVAPIILAVVALAFGVIVASFAQRLTTDTEKGVVDAPAMGAAAATGGLSE